MGQYGLYFQCLQDEMTQTYMDEDFHALKTYESSNCVNATNIPCWVPQMKDIVDPNTQKNLDSCSYIMDYNCEKMVLFHGLVQAPAKCPKPCEKVHYKLIEKEPLEIPQEQLNTWVPEVGSYYSFQEADDLTKFTVIFTFVFSNFIILYQSVKTTKNNNLGKIYIVH